MILEPPSAAKRDLIRQFLEVSGLQREIETGSFLLPLYMPRILAHFSKDDFDKDFLLAAHQALRSVYGKHRLVWQAEYESHANWEFTEEELREIVSFLGGPAGQHYLEGSVRMRAYIGTNTEELGAQIVSEAHASLSLG